MTRLCVVIFVCAFAATNFAFPGIPRIRRDIIDEPAEQKKQGSEKCAPQTPCAWSIASSGGQNYELNITNAYCECDETEECRVSEYQSGVDAYVYRCRKPGHQDQTV